MPVIVSSWLQVISSAQKCDFCAEELGQSTFLCSIPGSVSVAHFSAKAVAARLSGYLGVCFAWLQAGASAFAVGIAAWPWGLLSDRIGRKPVILIGNSATAACILMFGTAKVYWIALLSRLLAGSLDGSLVYAILIQFWLSGC